MGNQKPTTKIENKSRNTMDKSKHTYDLQDFFDKMEISKNNHAAHKRVLDESFDAGVILEDSKDYSKKENLENEKDAYVVRDEEKYKVSMRTLNKHPAFPASLSLRTRGRNGGFAELRLWQKRKKEPEKYMSLVILDENGDVGFSALIDLKGVFEAIEKDEVDAGYPKSSPGGGEAVYIEIEEIKDYVENVMVSKKAWKDWFDI